MIQVRGRDRGIHSKYPLNISEKYEIIISHDRGMVILDSIFLSMDRIVEYGLSNETFDDFRL